MNRHRAQVLAAASLSLGLLVPARAHAAALTQVTRSAWVGSATVPSYDQMYIYVPDTPAAKPPIVVSAHSCGSNAPGQMNNIQLFKAGADKNGYILILPDNQPQNCWDVGAAASLKHDGGGDTQAVALMVKYAIAQYNADPKRVYAMGGSGGAMLVQALMAVYPDVFTAGAARAGVPAGCWADGYDSSMQWSNNCAGGNTTKTAQQWGDLARAMYPGYTGHRPRLQTYQGTSDTTVNYKNTAESIKQWTNVLGLTTDPTTTDTGYKAANATYDRKFWKNSCGYVVFESWSSPGGTHSMPYEEADMIKFFGLDVAGGTDPEPDCTGAGGAGGMGAGGMSTGGMGAGGMGAGGVVGAGGMGAGGAPSGGMGTGGGSGGTAGTSSVGAGTGGITANGGGGGRANGTGGGGGMPGAAGQPAMGAGGSSAGMASGATTGAGGSVANGGRSAGGSAGQANPGGPGTTPEEETAGGCGCVVAGTKSRHAYSAGMALGLALLAFRRRRRTLTSRR